MLVMLDIKNESKIDSFLNFIKTLDYIDIKLDKKEFQKINKVNTIKDFSGLWGDRDIDIDVLRDKAWRR